MTNPVSPEELWSIKYLLSNENETPKSTKPQNNNQNQQDVQQNLNMPTNFQSSMPNNLQTITKSIKSDTPHPTNTKAKIGRKSIMTPAQFDHFAKMVSDFETSNHIKMSWKHAAKLIQDITKQTIKIPRTSAARYLNLAEMKMSQI